MNALARLKVALEILRASLVRADDTLTASLNGPRRGPMTTLVLEATQVAVDRAKILTSWVRWLADHPDYLSQAPEEALQRVRRGREVSLAQRDFYEKMQAMVEQSKFHTWVIEESARLDPLNPRERWEALLMQCSVPPDRWPDIERNVHAEAAMSAILQALKDRPR